MRVWGVWGTGGSHAEGEVPPRAELGQVQERAARAAGRWADGGTQGRRWREYARSGCLLRQGAGAGMGAGRAGGGCSGQRSPRSKIALVNGSPNHGSNTSTKRQVKARTKMPLVNDSFTSAISVRRFRSFLAFWNVSAPLPCSRDGTAGARHRPALHALRPNRSFARRRLTPRPHTFTRRLSANQLPVPLPTNRPHPCRTTCHHPPAPFVTCAFETSYRVTPERGKNRARFWTASRKVVVATS